jgi:hypothetical protein
MHAEDAHTQNLIDASATALATCCGEKKDLLSDDPLAQASAATASPSHTKHVEKKHLPALTLEEWAILESHTSCTWCWKLYTHHKNPDCPMKAENTWPDAEKYVTLMAPVTVVATEEKNNETRNMEIGGSQDESK